ncbi:hypothetical protein BUALT_Bualt11G0023300 [Buddleja alternifolia]|uniref:USP domain-containing protein n=1 Tax=Buddleja alternifolia TaxID=168488 RepID=A0AAV6WT95_9LAMI|nr:hypothetical protein BUALT_Bualt11G0023300 [Buddleja alternifolia]
MIVIVAIFLIFGFLVHHKWRNAAAKKDEILRLVAITSEEEAEIAKIQEAEDYYAPPPQPPPQLEKRYYCAVCNCPTTTSSGKCQIIHWRGGHKDDCRQATSLHACKEGEYVETASGNQFDHLDEAKMCPDPTQEFDDCGSSSSSLPCFSTSTERSETSFDASTSEDLESETSIRSERVSSQVIGSHMLQSTSDSDEADVPVLSPLNNIVTETVGSNNIKWTVPIKPDEGFQSTSFKNEITGNGAAVLEECALGTTDPRSSQSSSSLNKFSSAEDQKYKTQPSSEVIRPMSFNGSGNHQMRNVELRSSQCSKSLRTSSSDEYWKNESQPSYDRGTRSTLLRSSASDQKMCTITETPHALPSDIEGVRTLSNPTSKGLKTSVRKFAQHFRVPKQLKSYAFDVENDSGGTNNHKIIFSPKLFMQLYSCDDVELHPFGLVNCGNRLLALGREHLQWTGSSTLKIVDLYCWAKGQEMTLPSSPIRILSQIQKIGSHLSHGRQEDAHDFLRNMVETMQCSWLKEAGVSGSLAEDSTLLGLTFGGYLQSKIKCMKCLGRSEQCDRMMDLTVEIDGPIDTLEDALAQFTRSETLAGDDKYKCSRCKSYEKAKKKLTILEAPNILTIILKRFRSGNSEKLNKLVKFPEVLNLAPYMSGTSDKYPNYHLYAVVVHLNTRNAAYSGHYISYIRDFRGDWFRIDDSRVSRVDLETILSVEAYILFYARHTPRGPSLMRNGGLYCDVKTKRNKESVFSSTNVKKKDSKSRLSSSGCAQLHQRPERLPHWMSPDDLTGNHIADSSIDSSSIFSSSDAGSYSTDSTKDSSAEEISGYIFGHNTWYQP